MTEPFDKTLRKMLFESGKRVGIESTSIHEGVYVSVAGPNYESKAESR